MGTLDYFKELGKSSSKKLKKEQESKGNYKNFEPYNYTAFENVGESKIIRFTENAIVVREEDYNLTDPDGNKINNKYSPKIVNLVTGYTTGGKKFYAYVPSKKEEPGHFFWRMWDLVMKKKYVDDPDNPGKKKGEYINIDKHSEIFDRFKTNGRKYNISPNQYDIGLRPQETLISNVIDRELMSKHRELKHTYLLSKNVNIKDDITYFDRGIPSFGLYKLLLDKIVSLYGPLSFFDIALNRIGEPQRSWDVLNATTLKQKDLMHEIPKCLHDIISINDELTEEEKSWKQYDILDMTKPTLDLKWFNKIGDLIQKVDAAFNTRFYEEIKEKADKQKEEFEEINKEKEQESVQVQGSNVEKEETNRRTLHTHNDDAPISRSRRTLKTHNDISSWDKLKKAGFVGDEFWNEKVESMIENISINGEVTWKPEFASQNAICADEDNCKFISPEVSEIKGCIKCGYKF